MEHYKTLVEQSKLHIQSRIVDQQQHSNPSELTFNPIPLVLHPYQQLLTLLLLLDDENTEAEVEPIDLSEHEVQSKLVTEADLIARVYIYTYTFTTITTITAIIVYLVPIATNSRGRHSDGAAT